MRILVPNSDDQKPLRRRGWGGRSFDHLFFDLDNTLWDFDSNSRLAMLETVSQLQLSLQIEDFDSFFEYYETVNSNLWEAYRKKEIRKPELIQKRFEDTLNQFNIDSIDPLKMNEKYLELMPLQTKLFPDVVATLDYLKKRRYQMHIITNGFSEVQHRKIESSGLKPYFSRIFISEEIQAPKPDRRIFEYALTSCNARKSRSLMIGDNWDTDIVGAMNYGISQAYINNSHKVPPTPQKKQRGQSNFHSIEEVTPRYSTYVIEKISHLTKIL